MRLIYKPDNENFIWTTDTIKEDEELPEGYTTIAPPTLNWRPIFDWEANEWIETATEWEKQGFETEEEMVHEMKLREIEEQVQVGYQKQMEVLNKFLLNQLDNMIYSGEMTEEEAFEYVNAYPPFEIGVTYKVGDKVQYDGVVYEVIQEHTSQLDWIPNTVPALFKVYLGGTTEDGEQIVHDWVQPLGAHDAYKVGDLVVHDGHVWKSDVDGNVWKPGQYGWSRMEV